MNEQCPRCGSYNTQKASKLAVFLTLFGSGGCLIWVGFLFWPLWIFAGLLILASPLGFLVPKMTICRECNYSWRKGEAHKFEKASDDIEETTKKSRQIENSEETITFRIVGVTKENENNINIQSVLKKIIKSYKQTGDLTSFDGLTNSQILKDYKEEFGPDNISEFESQYIYNNLELVPEPENPYDENAVKVYLYDANGEKHHIGYVGGNDNLKVKNLIKNKTMKRNHIEFIGGKHKFVDYDESEDKEFIKTKDLNIGVSVNITFDKE